MWNLKNASEQTKQGRNRPIDTENNLMIVKGEGIGEIGEEEK